MEFLKSFQPLEILTWAVMISTRSGSFGFFPPSPGGPGLFNFLLFSIPLFFFFPSYIKVLNVTQ